MCRYLRAAITVAFEKQLGFHRRSKCIIKGSRSFHGRIVNQGDVMANPGQELSSINFGALIGGPLVAVIEAQTMAARATADFIKAVGFDDEKKPIYVEFKYPKEVAPYKPAVPAQVTGVIVNNGGDGYDQATVDVAFTPGSGEASNAIMPKAKAIVENAKIVRVDMIDPGTCTVAPTAAITLNPTNATAPTTAASVSVKWQTEIQAVDAKYQDMKIEVPIVTMLPIPFIRIEEATIDFNAKINSMETKSESTDTAISGNLEVRQRWPSGSAKLNVSASYQKKTASGSTVERTYSMQIHVRASQDEMPAGMEKLLGLLEGAMKATPLAPPGP